MSEPFSAWIAKRVPIYLSGLESDMIRLQQALVEDDFAGIQRIAHNMKGTGNSYGFSGITELGQAMEEAAKANDRSETAACVAAVREYLHGVRSHCESHPTGGLPEVDKGSPS